MKKSLQDKHLRWALDNVIRARSLPEPTLRRIVTDAWKKTYWIGLLFAIAGSIGTYFLTDWLQATYVHRRWAGYAILASGVVLSTLLGNYLNEYVVRSTIERLVGETDVNPTLSRRR